MSDELAIRRLLKVKSLLFIPVPYIFLFWSLRLLLVPGHECGRPVRVTSTYTYRLFFVNLDG